MKVAAFNVRNLGRQKVTDKMVCQYITEVLILLLAVQHLMTGYMIKNEKKKTLYIV